MIDVVVPPNTTATAILPTSQSHDVLFNGKPLSDQNVRQTRQGSVSIELPPGNHRFEIREQVADVGKMRRFLIRSFLIRSFLMRLFRLMEDGTCWCSRQLRQSLLGQRTCVRRLSGKTSRRCRFRISTALSRTRVSAIPKTCECGFRSRDRSARAMSVLISFWMRRPGAGGQPNNVYLFVDAEQDVIGVPLSTFGLPRVDTTRSFVQSRTQDFDSSAGVPPHPFGRSRHDRGNRRLRLVNYGTDRDIETLPRSTVMYRGRETGCGVAKGGTRSHRKNSQG